MKQDSKSSCSRTISTAARRTSARSLFEFENTTYEIDLGPKHHAKLQKVLGPFIEAGTKVASRGRTSARRGPARSAGGAQKEFNVGVRDWAAANGYEVKPRGRIPEPVLDAFHKAGKK